MSMWTFNPPEPCASRTHGGVRGNRFHTGRGTVAVPPLFRLRVKLTVAFPEVGLLFPEAQGDFLLQRAPYIVSNRARYESMDDVLIYEDLFEREAVTAVWRSPIITRRAYSSTIEDGTSYGWYQWNLVRSAFHYTSRDTFPHNPRWAIYYGEAESTAQIDQGSTMAPHYVFWRIADNVGPPDRINPLRPMHFVGKQSAEPSTPSGGGVPDPTMWSDFPDELTVEPAW